MWIHRRQTLCVPLHSANTSSQLRRGLARRAELSTRDAVVPLVTKCGIVAMFPERVAVVGSCAFEGSKVPHETTGCGA